MSTGSASGSSSSSSSAPINDSAFQFKLKQTKLLAQQPVTQQPIQPHGPSLFGLRSADALQRYLEACDVMSHVFDMDCSQIERDARLKLIDRELRANFPQPDLQDLNNSFTAITNALSPADLRSAASLSSSPTMDTSLEQTQAQAEAQPRARAHAEIPYGTFQKHPSQSTPPHPHQAAVFTFTRL